MKEKSLIFHSKIIYCYKFILEFAVTNSITLQTSAMKWLTGLTLIFIQTVKD